MWGKINQMEQDMFLKCEKRAGTKKKKKLSQAERLACSGGSVTLMKKLEKEINKILDKEA